MNDVTQAACGKCAQQRVFETVAGVADFVEEAGGVAQVPVPEELLGSQPCYVLKVSGDSMIEEGILDGDYVVIEQRDSANNGDIVVALVNNEEATLKRIEQKPGRVILYPANASMTALEYSPEEVQIQGVLRGLLRSYR